MVGQRLDILIFTDNTDWEGSSECLNFVHAFFDQLLNMLGFFLSTNIQP